MDLKGLTALSVSFIKNTSANHPLTSRQPRANVHYYYYFHSFFVGKSFSFRFFVANWEEFST